MLYGIFTFYLVNTFSNIKATLLFQPYCQKTIKLPRLKRLLTLLFTKYIYQYKSLYTEYD